VKMRSTISDHSEGTVEDLHGRMEAGANDSGANADLAVVAATATLVDDSNNITSRRSVRSST
jgi:hypothetical protein